MLHFPIHEKEPPKTHNICYQTTHHTQVYRFEDRSAHRMIVARTQGGYEWNMVEVAYAIEPTEKTPGEFTRSFL